MFYPKNVKKKTQWCCRLVMQLCNNVIIILLFDDTENQLWRQQKKKKHFLEFLFSKSKSIVVGRTFDILNTF